VKGEQLRMENGEWRMENGKQLTLFKYTGLTDIGKGLIIVTWQGKTKE